MNTRNQLGHSLRIARLTDTESGRIIILALDHGLFLGPVPGVEDLPALLQQLATDPPDAIQLTPGMALQAAEALAGKGRPALVVRLDTTNIWRKGTLARAPGYWEPVCEPLEALKMGADAAVCFLLQGWEDDEREGYNLSQITRWAAECNELGLPLIIEPLPIQPRVQNQNSAEEVILGARMATELGASLLKVNYTGDQESFAQVVKACHIPVLMRGGPKTATELEYLQQVEGAIAAGAKGVVVGRNIFQATDPAATLSALRRVIHQGLTAKEAMEQASH